MDLFVIDSFARDVDDRAVIVSIGKNRDGRTVCVRVPFQPSFSVLVPQSNPSLADKNKMKRRVHDAFDPYNKGNVRLELVEARQFVGYRRTTDWFVKASFSTITAFKRAKYAARDAKLITFEAGVDPVLKYFHATGSNPVGWTRFESTTPVVGDSRITKAHVTEFTVPGPGCVSDSSCSDVPKLKIASFDLECYSSTGKFPDGSIPRDQIISIGTTYASLDGSITRQTVHQLEHCDEIDGVDVHVYDDEVDEINSWLRELENEDVDVIMGYNIFGFDLKFICDRADVLISMSTGDTRLELGRFGRLVDGGGERVDKQLSSAAYGDNKYVYVTAPGVVQLDLLAIYRKELKLDSYTLNAVSSKYLDHTKLDVSAKEMFEWYATKDRAGLTRMAEYCVRDTELPVRLNQKLSTLVNQIEMARVVCVPLSFLNFRGQQIRCFSLIARYANQRGFIVNDCDKVVDKTGYVGATVLTPEVGAYVNDCVTCLDFASLYPSIMRAHSMCPSTIVFDGTVVDDGTELYTIETTPGRFVSFAQTGGVVPKLLEDLATWRKRAKTDMASAKQRGDTFGAAMQNAKQLAFKVAMNSIYGFFGAGTSPIPLLDLASAVTSTGRDMILRTKRACEERGHRVVYGDSVAPYTPIHIRWGGVEYELTTFELLAGRLEWTTRDDGKEYAVPAGLETWSDAGWTTVRAVIRHAHTQPLVRVCTHTGIVDVTRDHSLLRPDGSMVKPSEVTVGDKLLHAPLPSTQQGEMPYALTDNRLYSFSKALGFFMGDGSCGRYRCPSGMKCTWAMNNSDRDMLTEYSAIMSSLYPDIQWRILDTMHSSHVYKLVPKCSQYGRISELVDEWRQLCYRGNSKIVPGFIYNAPVQVMKSFIYGFDDADGDKSSTFRMDQKTQLSAAALYRLYLSAGYSVSITTRPDKPDVFRLNASRQKLRREPTGVKKMMPVQSAGMVYDLTTDNHHFSSGVGELVVHNTDSVFVVQNLGEANRVDVAKHIEAGGQLAAELTSTLYAAPNELEYEKVNSPMLLFAKKRYAAKMFEFDPTTPTKIDIKGLQIVRRDSPPFVRRAMQLVLDAIMDDRCFDKALSMARSFIGDLLDGKIPFDEFIVSKALRSGYANPQSMPHWQVAQKRKQRGRDPPGSGERVPFVIVRSLEHANGLIAMRAEDPVYVKEHDLELDYLYYINNCLIKPVVAILELEYGSKTQQLLLEGNTERIMKLQSESTSEKREAKRLKFLKDTKQHEITTFFKRV